MKWAGNKLISVVGARSKDLLVLEDAVRDVSHQTYIMTDDGTAGEQGLVTNNCRTGRQRLGGLRARVRPGPDDASVRQRHGAKENQDLNSIMVDGTGMCVGCRVLVNNRSQLACIDGPEFDAQPGEFRRADAT